MPCPSGRGRALLEAGASKGPLLRCWAGESPLRLCYGWGPGLGGVTSGWRLQFTMGQATQQWPLGSCPRLSPANSGSEPHYVSKLPVL